MIQRLRIGYVIGQLSQGGAERQLYELVHAMDRTRFRSIVYCLSEQTSPYGSMLREARIPLRTFARRSHFDIGRVLKLADHLRRDRVDILHSFLFHGNGYAWAAQRVAGVPCLVTSARSCKGVGQIRDWVNRLAFRMSSAIVCNGDAVRAFVVQHYRAPAHKIRVIHNGVDAARFRPGSLPPRVAASPSDRLVITVGRLVPAKDLDLFLDAAALVARRHPQTRFLVVGDGPCRGALERAAASNGLGATVSFLGERTDVPELLQAADVFWLTSAWEGFPNALLEAMACGKPVVTRDVGACREVVRHGLNGFLVPNRDAEAFAHYTIDLLADPVRAGEMGHAARRLVEEKFSVTAMARNTERLYDSLAAAARSSVLRVASPSARNGTPSKKR